MDDGGVKALVAEIRDREHLYPMLYRAGLFGEKCIVYQPVLIPVDAAQLGTISADDLMIHFWMGDSSPHNRDFVADEDWICTQITSIVGTDIELESPLCLYTRPRRESDLAHNLSILNASHGKCKWYGNVLIVKRTRKNAVTNIATTECALIKLAVIRMLQSGSISQTS
ncbi:hypothetical protein AURDEDRAFT_161262 [Auricularia subglabra TFB-10046 SS5]|nr:hypothetical protein AURDEDRAFT_161262 [Auricularia subglabra TFB-10046 SS5]